MIDDNEHPADAPDATAAPAEDTGIEVVGVEPLEATEVEIPISETAEALTAAPDAHVAPAAGKGRPRKAKAATAPAKPAAAKAKAKAKAAKPAKEPKAKVAKPAKADKGPTKKDQLDALLRRKSGATVAEISESLGWLPHTTRAAISRVPGTTSEKIEGRGRVYRLAAAM